MNNKRNVIVMFLFVMLSFAIISEVSAVSDAEADGTGLNIPKESVDMINHDIASERNDKFMQNHDMEKFESHNKQNSFNKSPGLIGDKNIENKNFYEHKMDQKPDDMLPLKNNFADGNKSMDMLKADVVEPSNNSPIDLRDNNFTAVPRGEAMNDVIPKFNNAPIFKNDGNGPQLGNVSEQPGFDDRNKSAMLPDDIKNSNNIIDKPKDIKPIIPKMVKNNKSNPIKQVNTKFKSAKKINNGENSTIIKSKNMKSSIREMAKL